MKSSAVTRHQVDVCVGRAGLPAGRLVYVKQARREYSAFAYDERWLSNPDRFAISPDLELAPGFQLRKVPSSRDSIFHLAFADTAPDAWGRRVIARDHARRRRENRSLAPLTEMDYLLAVDDFSRVGALRLRDGDGRYHQSVDEGRRSTPPLVELQRMYEASRAIERGRETAEDLRYLQGKGTSLGGLRPKCTVVDEDGRLAVGKFPSVDDTRSVTRGEVLALCLARRAGIDAASARIVALDDVPMAVIRRFDRDGEHRRIPYLSAASLLQASRTEERAYTEIADALRACGDAPTRDSRQLWRRMLFNLLITNVDDHLQNHAFLHVDKGLWRLAPAFDLNPFPDRERESRTWLSEQDGPVTDVRELVARCAWFSLTEADALAALSEVYAAISAWREVALDPAVGLHPHEMDDFAAAFEHEQMAMARSLLK